MSALTPILKGVILAISVYISVKNKIKADG